MGDLRAELASLERFYSKSNRIFGREYRRTDRVPFLAFFEVAVLFFEDVESSEPQPNELVFLRDGTSLTWREYRDLSVVRRKELSENLGASIVRNTWMSAIEALTPGLLKVWHLYPKLDRRLDDMSKREGVSRNTLKRHVIQTALLLVAEDRMRRQDVRVGSHGKWLRDVVPGRDLKGVEFMRWFKARTLSAAEAHLLEEDWPRKDGSEHTDIYERGSRADSDEHADAGAADELLQTLITESPPLDRQLDAWSFWARVAKGCSPEVEEVLRLRLQGCSLREVATRTGRSLWKVQSLWEELRASAVRANDPNIAS